MYVKIIKKHIKLGAEILMKKVSIVLGIILLFIVTACSNNESASKEDIKELVHEYSVGEFEEVSASITSHELIVLDEENETVYDISEEDFFVSIAPYIETTHPCKNHSLTGCQGELVEEEFDLKIEDEDGNVIIDETVTSLENGFIDLWLPRDKTYQVKIEYDGMVTESEISTFEGDNTCITTMQLI